MAAKSAPSTTFNTATPKGLMTPSAGVKWARYPNIITVPESTKSQAMKIIAIKGRSLRSISSHQVKKAVTIAKMAAIVARIVMALATSTSLKGPLASIMRVNVSGASLLVEAASLKS